MMPDNQTETWRPKIQRQNDACSRLWPHRFLAFFLLLALGCVSASAQCEVFVPTHKSNSVAVFNTLTNTVDSVIPVQVQPYGVAIQPQSASGSGAASIGPFVYVTNSGWFLASNSVSVIDAAQINNLAGTSPVVATIPVGQFPIGVAFTPNGAFAYVANQNSNSVSVINTTTRTAVATVSVGVNPWGVAITPNGAFAYVTNQASNSVSVINTATNSAVGSVSVGPNPTGVAITPDGAFAYVTNYLSNNISVINTATNAVVNTITVRTYPIAVAITPNGAFAYVVNNGLGSNSVSVINTATGTVVANIGVGSDPRGVAIDPYSGTSAYVTNRISNTVSVIDTATNTVVATVPGVSVFPEGIAIMLRKDATRPTCR
jgi:YVTN family beta-propeller protein